MISSVQLIRGRFLIYLLGEPDASIPNGKPEVVELFESNLGSTVNW